MIKLKSFLYILSNLCVFSNKHSSDWSIVPTHSQSHHRITASPHHRVTTSSRHRVTAVTRISQSFALPPATKPVSHLPCPLPPNQSVICLAPYHRVTASPHHRVTALVNHLPCPLPPSQSVICLCPLPPNQSVICLAPTTASPCHRVTASPRHLISQSLPCPCHQAVSHLTLLPATKPLSHLSCPMPPNQSVICLAPYHRVTASLH